MRLLLQALSTIFKKYAILTSVAIVFQLTLLQTISAQWSTNANLNTPVSTIVTNTTVEQQVISDGAGGSFILWRDSRGSTGLNVYAQRLNAAGVAQWAANGVPVCNATGDQNVAQMVLDGSGGIIVTWQDTRNTGYDIYAQRLNSAGVAQWTTDGIVVSNATNNQQLPAITSDGAGGAIIAWADGRNISNNYTSIYAQRLNAAGVAQWTANGVAIYTAANGYFQYAPTGVTLLANGNGGAFICWPDKRNNNDFDLYAQSVNAAGAIQWAVNGVPVCTSVNDQYNGVLVLDGAGGVFIDWMDYRSGTWNFYGQRLNSAGVAQWATNGVAVCNYTLNTNPRQNLSTISDGAGGVIATWQDYRTGGWDIYVQRINSSGVVQWTTNGIAICNATNDQLFPFLITDTNGGAIITWQDYRSGSHIYAQRINSSGVAQWAANGVAVSLATAQAGQQTPVIDVNGAGGAIIVFNDDRQNIYYRSLWAQSVNADGTLGVASSNANLSALTISVGTLAPTFAAATTAYTTSVSNAITNVTVTPTKADANATIQVSVNSGTYATVASGSASASLALNVGSNTIDVKVTAENGTTINIYTITVTRAALPVPPTITSFTPTSGVVGTTVSITGTGFSTTASNNIVFFGAIKAAVSAASATNLTVTVPVGATYESISVINSSTGLQVASGEKFSPTITTPKSILPATDFEPIKDLGSNGQQAIATQLADIDGDGKLDVINGLQNGNMSVRRNTSTVGNISLASPVFLNGTSNGFIIAKVADMDGDGKLDIIGVSNADNFIRVYINNSTQGTISFSSQKTFFIATTSGALNNLEVADFDNDGKPDMVIVDGWGTSASMFRNTSTGTGTANLTFATPVSVPGLATGENINSTYAGDVDGDGKMDLVISYCTVSAPTIIAVLKNQSTAGTFSFAAPVNLVHGTSSVQCGRLLKFADINGDGKLDILSINNQDNSLHYFINTTTASISFAAYQSIATIDNAQSFDMGDVNGDGKIDMVIQNATNYSGIQGNDQMLMANSTTAGNVSFIRSDIQQNLNSTTGSPNNYWRINLGDLDGDGKMDLYIASSNYPTSKSFAIRYNQQPTSITVTGTLTAFTGCSGTASASQSFIVSGSTLTANLVVTAPTGYEVSTTAGSGYASSVTLTPASGTVASTTIYVRLSSTATGSPAGNITVVSTGATTQNVAVTGTVNALPAATITAGGATTFCQGGSVTLTASTGSSYLWSNGATTQAITVSASGSYTVAVTNASNCSATSAATIVTVNSLPTATITAGGATTFCTGGSVVLTASTGSSYLWSNGATTQAITVTTAGSYTVKVTNTNGCFTTSAATVVTVNTLPTATITASGPIAFCAGGSVVLTASTGSSYLWSNGATTQAITVTTAGSYTVTVTNASGCSATSVATAVTINPASVATITASGATTFCAGGSVTLTTSPGVSYLWSTGATAASINVTTAGSYTVTVTNVTGCSATSVATVVTVNPLPVASISSVGTILCGTGATLNLTATGGTTYQWSNGTIPIVGATAATYTANAIGTYTATATTALGCTAPALGSIIVTQQVMPVPAYTYDSYCINKAIAFTNQSTVTGSGAVTYTWSDNAGNTTSTANANFTYTTAGNYSVKLKVQSNLCANLRDSITKIIPVEIPLSAVRYNTVDVAINDNIQLQARSFGNKYTWSPSTGLSNLFVSNPKATLNQQQEYRVAISAPSGCTTVDTILVRVQESNTVYVPNVFTPNGDGRNDKVIIIPVGITQLKSFRIYNRWNKKVFETADINGGWDGKVNGVLQPMDTYVWVVEAIAKDGNLIAKSGSITLLR